MPLEESIACGQKKHQKIEDPRGLKLNWDKPQVTYLSDSRPAVIDRAISLLAKEENIEFLVNAKAKVPAICHSIEFRVKTPVKQ